MRLWLNTNSIKSRVWQPAVRRWGKWGGALMVGVLPVVVVASGVYAAINLNAPSPAQHSALSKGIGIDQGENGLVGWWKLNGNAKDSTPYGDDGTPTNVTYTTDRAGQANGAASFNGTSNITLPYAATLQPTTGIAVSLWLNPSQSPSGNQVTFFGDTETGGYDFYIQSSTSGSCSAGYIGFQIYGANNGYHTACTPYALSNGTWYHLVGTFDGTAVKLYIDGVLKSSVAYAGSIKYAHANTTCIANEAGPSTCNGGDYFTGSMEDVRLYNRALTQTEISNLYTDYNSELCLGGCGQSGGINLQQGLVGYWPFDGDANDATPYGDNGTVSGAALTTDRLGRANSAYAFNGTSSYISLGTPSKLNGLQVPLTISGWFATNSSASYQPIYGAYSTATSGKLWSLVRVSNGVLTYETTSASGGYQAFGTLPVSLNTWHFVAVTVSGTTTSPMLTIYLDGSSQSFSMASLDSTPNLSVPIEIGGDAHGELFHGSISDIRVYNRALSPAELQALYDEN